MNIKFLPHAYDDYVYWQETDKSILKKINTLIKDIKRNPFSGLGKPEPLKENLSSLWSRRINLEHRLVYKIEGEDIIIFQARYHY